MNRNIVYIDKYFFYFISLFISLSSLNDNFLFHSEITKIINFLGRFDENVLKERVACIQVLFDFVCQHKPLYDSNELKQFCKVFKLVFKKCFNSRFFLELKF